VQGRWLDREEWPARARRLGPLRYSDLGRRALEPARAEVAEALAGWLSRFVDRCWDEAGRPDPFTVVVASGDDGTLAGAVLDARPRCLPALRYVLVDPDREGDAGPPPDLARRVPLENPAFLYPAAGPGAAGATIDDLDEGEWNPARGVGPLATFLTDMPSLGEHDGAVVAVGVLSRLPFDLFEWDGRQWREIRLAAGEGLGVADGPQEPMEEVAVDLAPASDWPAGAPLGRPLPGRYRLPTGAAAWLRDALTTFTHGRLAVVDEWDGGPENGPAAGLDLEVLRHIREPGPPGPEPVAGTSLSVVTWRLG
jgi:Putative S-adenosyl-L-methionine-dependent methyltransferase